MIHGPAEAAHIFVLTRFLHCVKNKDVNIIKRLSLRKKIAIIAVTITSISLAAGLTLMILYHYQASKISLLEMVRKQAALIGETASGTKGRISHGNAEAALTWLRNQPFVISGAVYNSQKDLIASYNLNEHAPALLSLDADASFQFHHHFLDVAEPVLHDSRIQGFVILRAATDHLREEIIPYILAGSLLFILLLPAAYILTGQLRKIVTRPVEKLMRSTQKIAGPEETARHFKRKQKNEIEILRNRFHYLLDIADFREMNIDKVKQTQQQVETAQEFLNRYREYFENTAAGYLVLKTEDKGENFIIFECNLEAERLTYAHRSDLIDKKTTDVFSGLSEEQIRKIMQQVWKTGEPAYFPYFQFNPKKNNEWAELYLTKLPSEKLIMVFHDVTQRKQEEDARKKWKAEQTKILESQITEKMESFLERIQAGWEDFETELAALFITLAEDLAAPLERIDEYSQSLLNTQSAGMDDQGKNDLIQVRAAEHRMKQLFKELNFLKEISQKKIKPEFIDLSAMVRKKTAELKEGNPNRNAQISIQDGLTDKGDPKLIRLVIENLVTNAWNFTAQSGETRIEFGLDTSRNIPEYFIRDNGIGFPQKQSERIFQPFVKLNPDDVYPGSGMGLALARRIIHRHFGIIRAESAPDQGAVFYFTLFLS
jgi:PAS domain S-box-containing protein